jgi:hypothetical protein
VPYASTVTGERFVCCFCGQGTIDADVAAYVELRLTLPESADEAVQHLGAHGGCLAALTRGIPLLGEIEEVLAPDLELLGPLLLAVARYDRRRGVVADARAAAWCSNAPTTGFRSRVTTAGLRDLARWCLSVSDETAPPYSHIQLDPGTTPLADTSPPDRYSSFAPNPATNDCSAAEENWDGHDKHFGGPFGTRLDW